MKISTRTAFIITGTPLSGCEIVATVVREIVETKNILQISIQEILPSTEGVPETDNSAEVLATLVEALGNQGVLLIVGPMQFVEEAHALDQSLTNMGIKPDARFGIMYGLNNPGLSWLNKITAQQAVTVGFDPASPFADKEMAIIDAMGSFLGLAILSV